MATSWKPGLAVCGAFAVWQDTAFIVHYARIAEAESAETFSVGCEMVQTDRRADEWRAVVVAVREAYSGIDTSHCDKY